MAVTERSPETHYREYIACLNRQGWSDLGQFVSDDVRYNGQVLGIGSYEAMLAKSFQDIPDLRFRIELLLIDQAMVATRLLFDCTPTGDFLGLPVNGRRVSFAENVFYRIEGGKIAEVWSIIDKTAIEAQLDAR